MVAIALAEIALALRDVAVDRLFQYLRLPPFVENLGKQPEIVPFAAGCADSVRKCPLSSAGSSLSPLACR